MGEYQQIPTGLFNFKEQNDRAQKVLDSFSQMISERGGDCGVQSFGMWKIFQNLGFRYGCRGTEIPAPRPVTNVLTILEEENTKKLFHAYLRLEDTVTPSVSANPIKSNPPSVLTTICVTNVAEYATLPAARFVCEVLGHYTKQQATAQDLVYAINSCIGPHPTYRMPDPDFMAKERIVPIVLELDDWANGESLCQDSKAVVHRVLANETKYSVEQIEQILASRA